MRNRAKCKLCEEVIESFHRYDYITCKCGEIAIEGGDYSFGSHAKDYQNFLRVNDNGDEKPVKYQESSPNEKPDEIPEDPPKSVTKKELIEILSEMRKKDSELPDQARYAPASMMDLERYMLIIEEIFKRDKE